MGDVEKLSEEWRVVSGKSAKREMFLQKKSLPG
jgi:hypothetical protein